MKTDKMWDAHYHAQQCANDLLAAYMIKMEGSRISPSYTESAVKNASKLAECIGYTLTPVAAPAQENADVA